VDAFSLVLVRRRDDLDDLIPWEFQLGDVHRGAMHQIRIQDAQDTLVSNNQEIVLLALEFKNDGLQSDSKVVV
jgi:hypothetical protein